MANETAQADPAAANPAPTVNPETHDPATGKPYKELAKEYERKYTESEATRARSASQPAPQPSTSASPEDYYKRLNETFVDDPAKAMVMAARDAMSYGIQSVKSANRMLKEVKSDLRKRYEDFADVAEEFDDVLEDAPLERMTKEGIEMVFQSVRSKKLEAQLKVMREKAAAKPAESPTTIVGPTSPSAAGSPATLSGQKPLTKAQQAEFAKIGDVSEEGYRHSIKARQERAKKLGIAEANWPQTISEPLKRTPS